MKCKIFNIRMQEYATADEAELNGFLKGVNLKRIFASVVNERGGFWSVLVFYEDESSGDKKQNEEDNIILTPYEEMFYEDLKKWRNDRATKEGIVPYMIAHNKWFKQMVKISVKTREDLLEIKGFGSKRITKYGDDILKILTGTK